MGAILPCREHVAIYGDISSCHNRRRCVYYWHQWVGARDAANHPIVSAQDSSREQRPASSNVSSAGADDRNPDLQGLDGSSHAEHWGPQASQTAFPRWVAKALTAKHMPSTERTGRIFSGEAHPPERKDWGMILE